MVDHTLAKYTVIQPKMPTTAANLMVCDKCEWKWYHEDENEQPRELSRPAVELLHHFASKHVCQTAASQSTNHCSNRQDRCKDTKLQGDMNQNDLLKPTDRPSVQHYIL